MKVKEVMEILEKNKWINKIIGVLQTNEPEWNIETNAVFNYISMDIGGKL